MNLRRRNQITDQFLLIMKQALDEQPGIPYFDFGFEDCTNSCFSHSDGKYLVALKELTQISNEEFKIVLNYCYAQRYILGTQRYIRITYKGQEKANKIEDILIEKDTVQDKNINIENCIKMLKLEDLALNENIELLVKQRIEEIYKCIENNIALGAIFLIGSTLEGLLLDLAYKYSDKFKNAKAGIEKDFEYWNLEKLITVSCELNFIDKDVNDISHNLRNYRNYIHPNKQIKEKFNPDIDTAKIFLQVLIAVINDLKNIDK